MIADLREDLRGFSLQVFTRTLQEYLPPKKFYGFHLYLAVIHDRSWRAQATRAHNNGRKSFTLLAEVTLMCRTFRNRCLCLGE